MTKNLKFVIYLFIAHDGIVRILNEKVKDKGVNADDDPTLVFAARKGFILNNFSKQTLPFINNIESQK